MKKILIIILAALLIFTACSNATENNNILDIDDLKRVREIVEPYLFESSPVTSLWLDEEERKIQLQFFVTDEEMQEFKKKFHTGLNEFIKNNQELSDLGVDINWFNLQGTGPQIYISVEEWESYLHQCGRILPEMIISNISPAGLSYKFINETDDEFSTDYCAYQLFVRESDVWKLLNQGMAYCLVSFDIMPQSQTEEVEVEFELSAGEYAFQKSFGSCYVRAHFTIQ